MVELIDAGKVRWGGVSNFGVDLLTRCESIRHVDSLQCPLSLINQASRVDLTPWCRTQGTGVIIYAPLASGLLSGAFGRGRIESLPADDGRRRLARFNEPQLSRNLAVVDRLAPIARQFGVNLPTLAVAWTLTVPGVTGAITGARHPDQVEGWLPASEFSFDDEMLRLVENTVGEIDA
jgi:aryl-alcohol dehydrogenase-like predicted oxidoreductase